MRVISQDGTMDVPYEISSFSMAVGKYENVEHAVIFCYNYSTSMGTKMAEYGSKEKAKKAMEMLRDAYIGIPIVMQNVDISENANSEPFIVAESEASDSEAVEPEKVVDNDENVPEFMKD